jgi:hypothetical protein
MLTKFDMVDCKSTSTLIFDGVVLCRDDGAKIVDEKAYKIIVRILMFLTHTRLDISYLVSLVSRYRGGSFLPSRKQLFMEQINLDNLN